MEDKDNYTLPVRTYTDFWTMEKKLYSLYDISLPAPISIRTVIIFIAVGVPWTALLLTLGVSFEPPWFILYPTIPLAAAYFGNKPVFEGKNIFQYASSRIKYIFQPHQYKGLEPYNEKPDDVYEIKSDVWHLPTQDVKIRVKD